MGPTILRARSTASSAFRSSGRYAESLARIEGAAAGAAPYFISTINLNFLVTSRAEGEFRDSLLLSDLCTADGMPVVWIARLLGVPLKERIAGSDIFDALKSARGDAPPQGVFVRRP